MKKSTAALLCAIFLVTAVVPAFALSGTKTKNANITGIGVHVCCTSSISLVKATAKVVLSYLPDPSNHLPESDYTCKAWIDIDDGNNIGRYSHPNYVVGMSTTTTLDLDPLHYPYTPVSSTYNYWVNGNTWTHTEDIP